jgi:hypothetical protein
MNPLNYEALAVIESGVILDDGSGSPGRLQEVGIIHIDYESCNDLYDGDIVCVYSVRHALCAGVPGVGEHIARRLCGLTFDRESTSTYSAKATLRSHFRSGKHKYV